MDEKQQIQKLRKSMMDLLACREQSRLELFNKMHNKGFNSKLINSNIEDFICQGWQSDSRYAGMIMRSRILKFHGPLKINNELKSKGVSSDIIQRCFQSDIDWIALAKEALSKRFSHFPTNISERTKQYRFLQQRGFTYEQINLSVNNFVMNNHEVLR